MKSTIISKAIFTLILVCFIMTANAQLVCGDNLLRKQFEMKYPQFLEQVEQTFKEARKKSPTRASVYRIPVVFHVVYNNDEENYSDDLIHDQIAVLNEDFRRLNANSVDTREIFEDVAADAEIEFFLAEIDPDGNPTTGITRTFTDKESFIELDFAVILQAALACGIIGYDITEEQLECLEEQLGDLDLDLDLVKQTSEGGIDAWDPDNYLNIWSCDLSVDFLGDATPFILGFAYPPVGAPNWPPEIFPPKEFEGVVLHYKTVGRNHPNIGILAGLNDAGRTGTHEVGHFLGLRHIWGDGDCTMDDGIDDTPTAANNSQTQDPSNLMCTQAHGKDSCPSDGLPDMVENYMDYYIESCQNMFTQEQVDLMRAMLEGPRADLVESTSSSDDILNISLQITPNPVNDLMWIKTDIDEDLNCQLVNIEGKVLRTLSLNKANDLTSLGQGVYFVRLTKENKQRSIRFVKL